MEFHLDTFYCFFLCTIKIEKEGVAQGNFFFPSQNSLFWCFYEDLKKMATCFLTFPGPFPSSTYIWAYPYLYYLLPQLLLEVESYPGRSLAGQFWKFIEAELFQPLPAPSIFTANAFHSATGVGKPLPVTAAVLKLASAMLPSECLLTVLRSFCFQIHWMSHASLCFLLHRCWYNQVFVYWEAWGISSHLVLL